MQKLSAERFEDFSLLITKVQNSIQKLKAKYCAQLGLKPSHIFWLYLLKQYPEGLSASELSEASKVDRSQISRGIEELFEADVVWVDTRGERRRYGDKIRLTRKGRRFAEAITLVVDYVQSQLSGDISETDLAIFYRVFNTIADRVETLSRQNEVQQLIDQFFAEHQDPSEKSWAQDKPELWDTPSDD